MNNDVIEYFKMIVDEINEKRNHMLGYPANVAKFRLNIFSRGKNMKKMMYLLWWNIIKY